MRYVGASDELFEILGDALPALIRDDPRPGFGVLLFGLLSEIVDRSLIITGYYNILSYLFITLCQ